MEYKLITALFGVLCAAAIAMVGLILFLMVDSVGLPTLTGSGTVTGKNYHPPYTSMVLISSGKTTTTVPQYHPARYSLCAAVAQTNEVACANFARNFWDQFEEGDRIYLDYSSGRFSKGTYLEGVSHQQ